MKVFLLKICTDQNISHHEQNDYKCLNNECEKSRIIICLESNEQQKKKEKKNQMTLQVKNDKEVWIL